MFFGRLIGWYTFFAGFAVLMLDVLSWNDTLRWAPLSFGQLWYDVSPPSLDFTPAVVQFYVWRPLWDDVVVRLLSCWAFAVLMVAGALIVHLFRERHPIAFRKRPLAAVRVS